MPVLFLSSAPCHLNLPNEHHRSRARAGQGRTTVRPYKEQASIRNLRADIKSGFRAPEAHYMGRICPNRKPSSGGAKGALRAPYPEIGLLLRHARPPSGSNFAAWPALPACCGHVALRSSGAFHGWRHPLGKGCLNSTKIRWRRRGKTRWPGGGLLGNMRLGNLPHAGIYL
jgi:hypothetical protein